MIVSFYLISFSSLHAAVVCSAANGSVAYTALRWASVVVEPFLKAVDASSTEFKQLVSGGVHTTRGRATRGFLYTWGQVRRNSAVKLLEARSSLDCA